MQQNEGQELKNKMKGTGKEMGEIAKILGMTRQNMDYHLAKSELSADFKRLIAEKNDQIFSADQFQVTGEAGTLVGQLTEDIICLKGDVSVMLTMLLELYASSKGTSYATEQREFLKNSKAATDRLFDELQKKSKQVIR